jgi:hypothetical protein
MDSVFARFLSGQHDEAMRLAAESDFLDVEPLGSPPHQRYLAHYSCTGLVRPPGGIVSEASEFVVGISLADDYLDVFRPLDVAVWLYPRDMFHPAVRVDGPFDRMVTCLGALPRGAPLVDVLFQLHEIVTWNIVNQNEYDALNYDACVWARHNPDRFPVDTRPLRRGPADRGIGMIEEVRK